MIHWATKRLLTKDYLKTSSIETKQVRMNLTRNNLLTQMRSLAGIHWATKRLLTKDFLKTKSKETYWVRTNLSWNNL